jgi:hypothetical protein
VSSDLVHTASLFGLHKAPFKWLRALNNMYSCMDAVVTTNDGNNFEVQNSFFDISRNLHLFVIVKMDDCTYMTTEGMGNIAIMNNLTITGINTFGMIKMILFNKPYNITFTNSRIIDAQWS